MSRVLTGDKLVESIRNRTMTPDDTSVFTDDNLLDIANEEMDVQLLDKLLSLHEENLTISVDLPRVASGEYEIPYRAIGNKVRDISMIKSSTVYEMSQISIGELADYSVGDQSYNQGNDKFYVENSKIKLVQSTNSYDSIRVYFYIRPNSITKLEKAGTISTISTDVGLTETTFTFTSLPSTFTTSIKYDVIGHRTPNKIKTFDLTALEVSTTLKTVKFAYADIQAILPEILVGDYICQAEESPVPNVPTEMHPLLAQLSAVNVLEALNDTEGLSNAERKLGKMEKSVMQLVDDRVELAPKKIKPRHGTLNEGRFGSYGKRRRGGN